MTCVEHVERGRVTPNVGEHQLIVRQVFERSGNRVGCKHPQIFTSRCADEMTPDGKQSQRIARLVWGERGNFCRVG